MLGTKSWLWVSAWAASLLLAQPKAVPSAGGASGAGTAPRKEPNQSPTLQTDFAPELTPALHPEGLEHLPRVWGPQIPQHVRPGGSEQGHGTGEPSQLQALEKGALCQCLLSTLDSQSSPFAALRAALSAVYRQRGAPQRA